MTIGAPPPKGDLTRRVVGLWDSVQMAYALWRHRDDVYYYFGRMGDLRSLLREKVGSEVWSEILSSPEDIAAIERGRADAAAGRKTAIPEK
jgi:hypothetical protein